MKKIIIFIMMLQSINITYSQGNNRADTTILMSVHNTGARFRLIPADFGGNISQDLVATMVRSYDTIMVLKENARADTTGRKPIRYKVERSCEKMSRDIKGKIVVMELNKDCDVTQTCLNVQRAGAKAFVIIHNSNSQGNIKLPKKGSFKDSIRIPIYTVRSGVGDSITLLLPTVVGIQKPVPTTTNASVAQNNDPLTQTADKTKIPTGGNDELNKSADVSINGIGKQGFTISPNPARNQVNVTYQFPHATDATIEVKAASGQVINRQILRGVTIGNLPISTMDYASGTYFVTLQYGKEVQTKKLIVRK